LIHQALLEPEFARDLPTSLHQPVQRLGELLAKAERLVEAGATTHEVVWVLWSDSGWARRLEQAAAKEGGAAHAANREIDAMVALFEAATRLDERTTASDVASFLAEIRAQQIPGDTLSERGVRREGVRLLTAHRSKGLEWEVVVVASVQADVWPDLRRRGSLLEPDRLRADGLSSPPSVTEVRRDERRLFYVAMTRAKRRLAVTAVDSPADEGLRPSSFIAELDVAISPVVDHPVRPLTLAGVCAELRAVVTDDEQPKELREAAALRLALMAMTEVEGQALIRAADPQHWWGLSEATHADQPIRSTDAPLDLSGSALEGLNDCALKWFLSREVRGEYTRGTAAGFGGVVHALADGVGRGELEASVDVLVEQADSVWSQLQYGAAWESEAEHQAAVEALTRFVDWHKASRGRVLVATEKPFEVTISVAGREVRLRGRLDRVELDDRGRVVVVDLKTGRYPPSAPKVERHLQLATYQRVVAEEGLDGVQGEPGGAELVHLRHDQSARSKSVKVQQQQAYPAGEEMLQHALLSAVAFIGNETFHASPGDSCSFCPFTTACPAQDSGRQVVT
jgi:RecB family exonuclease